MSQIEEDKISEKSKEDLTYLGAIFNLSQFQLLSYPEHPSENDILDENRKGAENKTYQNIVSGLESDLEGLGMDVTYTARIIIGEVAMNLLFMQRVKAHLICKNLLVEKRLFKKSHISSEKNYDYSHKKTNSTWNFYDYYPSNNHSIHPLFEKLIPQLQKQINDGLKALGLLPVQQIERQKLTIIKKLRQRYEQIDKEYTIKAESRKNLLNNQKNQPQEIKAL
ncbi:MAG: hypothetical protein Q7R52_03275 [archaeon]|nr:hypothetical protein [archaeon]